MWKTITAQRLIISPSYQPSLKRPLFGSESTRETKEDACRLHVWDSLCSASFLSYEPTAGFHIQTHSIRTPIDPNLQHPARGAPRVSQPSGSYQRRVTFSQREALVRLE
ncbi:unnamed protein product [Lota lota]